jgi:hypothetical protein
MPATATPPPGVNIIDCDYTTRCAQRATYSAHAQMIRVKQDLFAIPFSMAAGIFAVSFPNWAVEESMRAAAFGTEACRYLIILQANIQDLL